MIQQRLQEIVNKVRCLEQRDQNKEVFGASNHRYRLFTISEQEHIEPKGKDWPEDYILFLRFVGSGAGPYHGTFSVQESLYQQEEVWLLDLPVDDDNVKLDDEVHRLMIKAGATRNIVIPVCEYGCGERFVLVVSGLRKDSLWYDYGFGDNGIRPLKASFLDFYESWVDTALKQQDRQ